MKKTSTAILITTFWLFPVFTYAEGKSLKDIAKLVAEYLNIGLSLIIGLAIVVFVWNIFIYFFTEKDKTEAGKYLLFSVIGFFVILSFWGIVNLFINTLQLDNDRPTTIPTGFDFNSSRTQNTNNTAPSSSGSVRGIEPSNSGTVTSPPASGSGAPVSSPKPN
jgi:hypothetical protein